MNKYYLGKTTRRENKIVVFREKGLINQKIVVILRKEKHFLPWSETEANNQVKNRATKLYKNGACRY